MSQHKSNAPFKAQEENSLSLAMSGGSRHPLACGYTAPVSASLLTWPSSLLSSLLSLVRTVVIGFRATQVTQGFHNGSSGKQSICNAGDSGDTSLIPDWGDLLEKEMETHSSFLAWRIPWTEEAGRLQSMGLQRVSH